MALDGAWCLFTVERYFGSQPSTEAWYRVRDEPAIEVINDKHQGEDEHYHDDRADQSAGVNHFGHDGRDAHTAVDVGSEHAAVDGGRHIAGGIRHRRLQQRPEAQKTLERERHQRIHHHTQQAGIENGLERIGFWILQFRGVAHRRFKSVRRPSSEKHAAGQHGDAAQVPRAVDDMAHGVVGQGYQREKVSLDDVARQDRYHTDQNQRNHRRDAENLRGVGRAQNAAVLDGLDREQDHGAQQKTRH